MASAAAAKKWPRLSQRRACSGVHQPQVRLVDQGRGLERLAGLLLGQLLGGQLAQLVVDQRQELLGRLGVALLDGREDDVTSFIVTSRSRDFKGQGSPHPLAPKFAESRRRRFRFPLFQ